MTRNLIVTGLKKLARQNPLNQQLSQKNIEGCDFSRYADDPIRFGIDILGTEILTDEQKKLLLSIRDNRITNC
jgi:translation elongation factor EF-1beta